jgi:hypothetical protein
VGLDGGLAQEQLGGDLGVRQAAPDQPQHLGLPLGEGSKDARASARVRILDEALHQPPGHRRVQQ